METQIQLDKEVFYIFIKALRDTGTRATEQIADELEQAVNPASGAIVQSTEAAAPMHTPKSPPSHSDESHVPQASVSTSQTYSGAGLTGATPPGPQPPSQQPTDTGKGSCINS